MTDFRIIPSNRATPPARRRFGRSSATSGAAAIVDALREAAAICGPALAGPRGEPGGPASVRSGVGGRSLSNARARRLLHAAGRPSLAAASINATGVIVHTNLGRSPLSRGGHRASRCQFRLGYSNLEYDLDAGRRGHRDAHAEAPAAAPARRRSRGRREQQRRRHAADAGRRWRPAVRWSCRAANWWRSAAASACPT